MRGRKKKNSSSVSLCRFSNPPKSTLIEYWELAMQRFLNWKIILSKVKFENPSTIIGFLLRWKRRILQILTFSSVLQNFESCWKPIRSCQDEEVCHHGEIAGEESCLRSYMEIESSERCMAWSTDREASVLQCWKGLAYIKLGMRWGGGRGRASGRYQNV